MVLPYIDHASLSLEGSTLHLPCLPFLEGTTTLHIPDLPFPGRCSPTFTMPPFPRKVQHCIYHASLHIPGRYNPAFTMLPFSWKLLPCIYHASLSLKGSTLHLPSLLFPGRCSLHWPCLPFSFQISTACVLWILKKHICVHLIGTLQFPCFQSLSFILWRT